MFHPTGMSDLVAVILIVRLLGTFLSGFLRLQPRLLQNYVQSSDISGLLNCPDT